MSGHSGNLSTVSVRSPTEISSLLRAYPGNLYAVLDAARSPGVLPVLRQGGETFQSLFAGRRADNLASAAPYLVHLPVASGLFDRVIEQGWGKSWGVFIHCALPFDEVRRHLRTLLVVETERGTAVHFRFHDPRVLGPYLASCTLDEIARVFGPVAAVTLEGRDPGTLLRAEALAAGSTIRGREMLVIRDEQMAMFARAGEELLMDRLWEALAADGSIDRAAWDSSGAELRASVRTWVTSARRHGVRAEEDLNRFVRAMARIGPGDAQDARLRRVRSVLRWRDASDVRIRAIEKASFSWATSELA